MLTGGVSDFVPERYRMWSRDTDPVGSTLRGSVFDAWYRYVALSIVSNLLGGTASEVVVELVRAVAAHAPRSYTTPKAPVQRSPETDPFQIPNSTTSLHNMPNPHQAPGGARRGPESKEGREGGFRHSTAVCILWNPLVSARRRRRRFLLLPQMQPQAAECRFECKLGG